MLYNFWEGLGEEGSEMNVDSANVKKQNLPLFIFFYKLKG